MATSIYFLSVALVGYLSSRLTEKYKSHFAHIIPLGLGITGLFYFWDILIWNKFNLAGFIIFVLFFALLTVLFLRIKKIRIITPIEFNLLDLIILGLLLLVALQQIYGYWDAWAIWNTKAKFLTSENWQQLFSPQIKWMHPDYPLLLPSIVAAGWSVSNTFNPVVPFVVALLFSWSIYLLVKDWISHLFNNSVYGVLGGLLMISLPAFLRWSGSQYADIPLANFILLGVTLLYFSTKNLSVFISGSAFGMAIFTKNEGLLYFVLILASFIYTFWRINKKIPFKSVMLLLGGALPGILSSLVVKNYATRNEFITNFPNIISSISFHRIFLILEGFLREFLAWKEWIVFWIIAIIFLVFLHKREKEHYFWNTFFTVLIVLCFVSFFFIYLVTPQDVVWHIQTSFNRLLIQIFPLVIVSIFIRLRHLKIKQAFPEI
ncbi:MAG: hypothetical protein HYX20_01530 [Candidatus Yanofskybacteria bacterium]|nr:hypothetical protein [Candidatus Yanofskybacteria bacterium]